jgi:hypothetical protein
MSVIAGPRNRRRDEGLAVVSASPFVASATILQSLRSVIEPLAA